MHRRRQGRRRSSRARPGQRHPAAQPARGMHGPGCIGGRTAAARPALQRGASTPRRRPRGPRARLPPGRQSGGWVCDPPWRARLGSGSNDAGAESGTAAAPGPFYGAGLLRPCVRSGFNCRRLGSFAGSPVCQWGSLGCECVCVQWQTAETSPAQDKNAIRLVLTPSAPLGVSAAVRAASLTPSGAKAEHWRSPAGGGERPSRTGEDASQGVRHVGSNRTCSRNNLHTHTYLQVAANIFQNFAMVLTP
jgi:hypothetical protein